MTPNLLDRPFYNSSFSRHLWENARDFLKKHAVATGREFTLKSGRKSDFYVDCRVAALMNDGQLRDQKFTVISRIVQATIDFTERETEAAAWAPVPLGGVLLLLHTEQRIPALIPRIAQKEHGMKLKVEGLYDASGERLLPEGARVILLEDVITTGGSTIAAAETLRREQLNPIGSVVLVDREEGGRKAIEKEGLNVWPIFTQSDLRG